MTHSIIIYSTINQISLFYQTFFPLSLAPRAKSLLCSEATRPPVLAVVFHGGQTKPPTAPFPDSVHTFSTYLPTPFAPLALLVIGHDVPSMSARGLTSAHPPALASPLVPFPHAL